MRTVGLLLTVWLIMGSMPLYAAAAEPKLASEAAIVVDVTHNQVLFGKNEEAMLVPASLTKVMTAFLAREAVETGKLSWDQKIVPGEQALRLTAMPGVAKVPLYKEPYTLKQLYDLTLVRSANEAAVALAEAVAGSEEAFVRLMNAKATELGMTQTTFANASGLNEAMSGRKGENLAAANDLARLVVAYMDRYPDVLEVTKKGYVDVDGIRVEATNQMLSGREHSYKGIVGFKTGTTDEAGNCLIAVSTREGRTVLSVVLGATSNEMRYKETKQLHDFAYREFKVQTVLRADESLAETVYVAEGDEEQVAIQSKTSVDMLVRKGEPLPKPSLDLEKQKAPVAAGHVVGTAAFELPSVRHLDMGGASVPVVEVVTAEAVERASWFVRVMRAIESFLDRVDHVLEN